MDNIFLSLIDEYLYHEESDKNDLYKKIVFYLESNCNKEQLSLIYGILSTYNINVNNFCVDASSQHRKELIPMFSMILSILNFQGK